MRKHSGKELEALIKFTPDGSALKSYLAETAKRMAELEAQAERANKNMNRTNPGGSAFKKWEEEIKRLNAELNRLGTLANSVGQINLRNIGLGYATDTRQVGLATAQQRLAQQQQYSSARLASLSMRDAKHAGYMDQRIIGANASAQLAMGRLNVFNTNQAQKQQNIQDIMAEASAWERRIATTKKLQEQELNQLKAFYREYHTIIRQQNVQTTQKLGGFLGIGGNPPGGPGGGGSGGGGGQNPIVRFLKQLTGIYGTGYAVLRAGQFGTNLIRGAADDYMYVEKIRTMMTGSLNTYYDQYQNGRLVTNPGQRLANAYDYSQNTLFKQMRKMAVESPLTMRELVDTYSVGLPFLARKGLTTTQAMEVANTVASIGKAAGLREGSFADDLRALGGSGQFRNAQTFQIMGYSREDFQKLSGMSGGKFMENFREHAKEFQRPLKDFGNSLTSTIDRVKDAIFGASITVGEKIAPALKKIANDISNTINKWAEDGTLDRFAQALSSIISGLGTMIDFVVKNAEKIATSIPGLDLFMIAGQRAEAEKSLQAGTDLASKSPEYAKVKSFENSLAFQLGKDGARRVRAAKGNAMALRGLVSEAALNRTNITDYYVSLWRQRAGDDVANLPDDQLRRLITAGLNAHSKGQNLFNPSDGVSGALGDKVRQLVGITNGPEEDLKVFRAAQLVDELVVGSPYMAFTKDSGWRVNQYITNRDEWKRQSNLSGKAGKALLSNKGGVEFRPKGAVGNAAKTGATTAGQIAPDLTSFLMEDRRLELRAAQLENERDNASPMRQAAIDEELANIKVAQARNDLARQKAIAAADVGLYQDGKTVGKIHPSNLFDQRLSAFRAAAGKAGFSFGIESGRRTLSEQAELYRKWKAGKGNKAAYPNEWAPHVLGVAADLSGLKGSKAQKWARANAAKFGLGFPVDGEAWHIQLAGGTAKSFYEAAKAGGLTDKAAQSAYNRKIKSDERVIVAATKADVAEIEAEAARAKANQARKEMYSKQADVLRAMANKLANEKDSYAAQLPGADTDGIERRQTVRNLQERFANDFKDLVGAGVPGPRAAFTALSYFGAALGNYDKFKGDALGAYMTQSSRDYDQRQRARGVSKRVSAFNNRMQLFGLGGSDLFSEINTNRLSLAQAGLETMTGMGLGDGIEKLIIELRRNSEAINRNSAYQLYQAQLKTQQQYDAIFNPTANMRSSAETMRYQLDQRIEWLGKTPSRSELMKAGGVSSMVGWMYSTDELRERAKQKTLGNFNTAQFRRKQSEGYAGNALQAAVMALASGGDPFHAFASSYNSESSQLPMLMRRLTTGKGPLNKRLSSNQWGQLGGEAVGGYLASSLGGYSDLGMSIGSMAASAGAFAGLGAWAGPVGMIGGALLGSLFGRKKGPSPEEQARKEHEKRLEQLLNSIDRSLRPQADYFRSIRSDVLFGSASRFFSGRAYSGLAMSASLGRL